MAASKAVGEILEQDLREVGERLGRKLDSLAGSTLLVAGGGGFLPSYLLDAVAWANDSILSEPCRLICVDNFSTGVPSRIAHLQDRADFRFIQHDLVIPLSLDEDVAYFVHGASIASPTQYRKFPLQTIDVNVVGTRHLLELARRRQARSFVYLSSSEVYGDPVPEAIPTPESYRGNVSSTGPRACYDESKRLAETLCFTYYREFGLPVIVVRPFNVYGPRMRLDDGRVIPDFVRDALEGSEIRVFSDGRVTRSFCYVSDAITAILLLMVSDVHGEVFNIGNNEEITIEDLAYKVARLFGGRKVRLVTNPDANYLTDSPRRRCPDITKVCSLINWEPTVTLREGLGRTAKWYRTQERSL